MTRPRSTTLLAVLAAAVAVLGGVAAAIGVFARGDGSTALASSVRGEVVEIATSGVYANNAITVVAEGVGWDVWTLVIVAPALALAAVGVWRGSFRASVAAAGLLAYFLYLHLEYAVTWAFGPLFVVFVIMTALSLAGLIGFGVHLARVGAPDRFGEHFPRRAWAALSAGMALLLTLMWSARIAEALAAGDAAELHGEVTMTVQALDLGIVVPVSLLLAAGVLLRDRAAFAASAAYAVTFVAMSGALVAMMISSWIVTGVSALVPITIFGVAAVAGAIVVARISSSVVAAIPHQAAPERTLGRHAAAQGAPL